MKTNLFARTECMDCGVHAGPVAVCGNCGSSNVRDVPKNQADRDAAQGRRLSDLDQSLSDRDQRSSNREQAASDRDVERGGSKADAAASTRTRDESRRARENTSELRAQNNRDRDIAAHERRAAEERED